MILVSIYLIARLEVPKEREMPKPLDKEKGRELLCFRPEVSWSRGADLNHRPSGYEPDELTRLLHPAMYAWRFPQCEKLQERILPLEVAQGKN